MFTSLIPSTSTVCPLASSWLLRHARIDQYADLDLIGIYSIVATEMVENYLSRYLLTREATWTVATAHSPNLHEITVTPWQWSTFLANAVWQLPRPVIDVSAVVLALWDQDPVTLVEGTDYQIDADTSVGRLRWISNTFLSPDRSHIQVTFTSGYGSDQSAVPAPCLHAITLLTTSLYENRGDRASEIWSPAIEALLVNYRYYHFG